MKKLLASLLFAASAAVPAAAQEFEMYDLGISDAHLILRDQNLPLIKIFDKKTGALVESVKTRQPVIDMALLNSENKLVAATNQYGFYVDLTDFTVHNETKFHDGGTYNIGNEAVVMDTPLEELILLDVLPNGLIRIDDSVVGYEWRERRNEEMKKWEAIETPGDRAEARAWRETKAGEERVAAVGRAREIKAREKEQFEADLAARLPEPPSVRFYDIIAAADAEDPGTDHVPSDVPSASWPADYEFGFGYDDSGEWLTAKNRATGEVTLELDRLVGTEYLGDYVYLVATEFTLEAYDIRTGEQIYTIDLY